MKRLLKRFAAIAAATMVGVTATLFFVSPANAATFTTTTNRSTPLLFCARSAPIECNGFGNVASGGSVKDFCAKNAFDLVFSTSVSNSVGFIRRTHLVNQTQGTACGSGGLSMTAQTQVMLQTCASNNCADVGPVFAGNQLRQYCQRTGQSIGGDNVWYVVYSEAAQMAGFAPRDLIGVSDNAPNC